MLVEMTLEKIIQDVSLKLLERDDAKDHSLRYARKARTLSKQAILYLHNKQFENARLNLRQAEKHLLEIENHTINFPELCGQETLEAAQQEYAEAMILKNLLEDIEYPDPISLRVSSYNYLLGLADIPGELRRLLLDQLREGNLDAAEKILGRMDDVYINLVAMPESHLLKGLRRKIDIARSIIERTHADITIETGRQRLTNQIKKLEERL
jgi:translin